MILVVSDLYTSHVFNYFLAVCLLSTDLLLKCFYLFMSFHLWRLIIKQLFCCFFYSLFFKFNLFLQFSLHLFACLNLINFLVDFCKEFILVVGSSKCFRRIFHFNLIDYFLFNEFPLFRCNLAFIPVKFFTSLEHFSVYFTYLFWTVRILNRRYRQSINFFLSLLVLHVCYFIR